MASSPPPSVVCCVPPRSTVARPAPVPSSASCPTAPSTAATRRSACRWETGRAGAVTRSQGQGGSARAIMRMHARACTLSPPPPLAPSPPGLRGVPGSGRAARQRDAGAAGALRDKALAQELLLQSSQPWVGGWCCRWALPCASPLCSLIAWSSLTALSPVCPLSPMQQDDLVDSVRPGGEAVEGITGRRAVDDGAGDGTRRGGPLCGRAWPCVAAPEPQGRHQRVIPQHIPPLSPAPPDGVEALGVLVLHWLALQPGKPVEAALVLLVNNLTTRGPRGGAGAGAARPHPLAGALPGGVMAVRPLWPREPVSRGPLHGPAAVSGP
jgi:hypothetical protein